MRALGNILQNNKSPTAADALHEQARFELQQNPHIAHLSAWSTEGKALLGLQQNALNTTLSGLPPSISQFLSQALRLLVHPAITAADGQPYLPVERVQRDAPQRNSWLSECAAQHQRAG